MHPLYFGPPLPYFPCMHEAIHIPEAALKLCLSPTYPLQSSSLNSGLSPTPSLVNSTQQTLPTLGSTDSQWEANHGQIVLPHPQNSMCACSIPTLTTFLLLITWHLSSKAPFQAHLSQDTFSDHCPSPGRFTI